MSCALPWNILSFLLDTFNVQPLNISLLYNAETLDIFSRRKIMKSYRTSIFILTAVFALLLMSISSFAQDGESETTTISSPSGDSETTTVTTPESEPETPPDASRPRIAVLAFENRSSYSYSSIGDGMTNIIVTELTKSGRFDVIQRGENLDLILDEISLGEAGYIEGDETTQRGHVRGIDYILSGKVTNFGYEEQDMGGFLGGIAGGFGGVDVSKEEAVARVDFALIDATTGETILSETAEGKESNTGVGLRGGNYGDWIGSVDWDTDEFMGSMIGHAALKAVDDLLDKILVLFPVQAPILAVTPDFLILDIGAGANIEEGMEFIVYRVSEVTNSSGEVVWTDKEQIGVVRITEIDLRTSKAVIVSGSGFVEGDLCELPDDVEED